VVAESLELVRKLRVIFNGQGAGMQAIDDSAAKIEAALKQTFGSAAVFVLATARETEERGAMYRVMKELQGREGRRYEEFYRSLGFPDSKKRKQKLCQRVFYMGSADHLKREALFVLYCTALQCGLAEGELRESWRKDVVSARMRENSAAAVRACLVGLQKCHSGSRVVSTRVSSKKRSAKVVSPRK